MTCTCKEPKEIAELCSPCQEEYLAEIHTDVYPPNIRQETSGGVKHDNGKPPLGLIPTVALIEEAKAFGNGRERYGLWNYKKGMEWMRLVDAALRHITAFKDGEDLAEDSKVHHLGHARACLGMLLDYWANGLGTDNRWKKP